MEDNEETRNSIEPSNMVVYDPDNLPYEKLHLCVYLGELPELDAEGREKVPSR
jgi:hypothetical protein